VSQTGSLTAPAREPGPPEAAAPGGKPWLVLIAVALGVMMVALDGTIVAVANPVIQTDLNASLADIQWVTNGYLLSLAVVLIIVGKLGDRFGHKKVFLTGVVGFAASSAAIGLSGSIELMIAFRVLQGVFGAMLQPTALALLRNTFSGKRLNLAIGFWGAIIGASTAAGPIVGGLLVQHVSWESVFYVNVPVGVIALVLGLLALRETRREHSGGFDLPGMVLLAGSLFLLVWGLIKAPSYGWGDGKTWIFLGGAVVVGLLFVLREARTAHPLLPLRLFRSPALSAGVVLVLMLMFAMFGALFFMTFYLENVFHLDPVDAGLRILPMTSMMIVGAPLSSLIGNRIGPRIPVVVGMLLAAVGLYGLSTVTVASGPGSTLWWFVALGLGLSPVIVGATDIIVGNAPVELAGVASGLQSTAMQLGGTLGTAVLGSVMASRVGTLFPQHLADSHVPAGVIPPQAMPEVLNAVSVGIAPVSKQMPEPLVRILTQVTGDTFVGGMHTAYLTAAVVAFCGALVGLLAKAGRATEGGGIHV
jgi:EmrB/QacA subfamily drug resistance transporter